MSSAFSYLVIGTLAFFTIKKQKTKDSTEHTKDEFILEGNFI